MKRTTEKILMTLAIFAMATVVADQGAPVAAEGKGEKKPGACRPAPHPHGFWHSECFETPREKGGAGGGTSTPSENDLIKSKKARNCTLASECAKAINEGHAFRIGGL